MGSPFPGSMAMPDVPDHFPITVDCDGNGPAGDLETWRILCWCGDEACQLHLEGEGSAIAIRMAHRVLRAQHPEWYPVSHLGSPCSEECFLLDGSKRPHA